MSAIDFQKMFDFKKAVEALTNVPTTLMHDIPSVAVMALYDFLGHMGSEAVQRMEYESMVPRHLVQGLVDTIRQDYTINLLGLEGSIVGPQQ